MSSHVSTHTHLKTESMSFIYIIKHAHDININHLQALSLFTHMRNNKIQKYKRNESLISLKANVRRATILIPPRHYLYQFIFHFFFLFTIQQKRAFSITLVQSRKVFKLQISISCWKSIINNMTKAKANAQTELKNSVVGVDLGSSFTKIAAVQKGVVDIITNEANLRQTPTIVAYGPNERLLGEAANVKIKSNLNNSILAPQRFLAISSKEYLNEEGIHFPCQLKQNQGEMTYKVNCQGQQANISPEQAVAAFFTKAQQIVELNNINNKFLTVAIPNFLSHQQRQAFLDSLQICKRSCKYQYGIQLVNESAAVGLDYGFYKKNQFPEKQEQAKNVMFIDFGHSKLSLYVIKFTKNYQKVVYQSHLRQLGCKNLDEKMLGFYSALFERNNPNLDITVNESKKATIKLLQNIEKQRKILSGISQYDFTIDCLLEECDISYTMKREEFQMIIEPIITQIRQFFIRSGEQLKAMGVNLSSIELIGGGSRIPIFMRTVSEAFGMQAQRTLNSSECIARGAGLFSAMNSGLFKMQPYYSVELSSETLALSWKGESEEIQNENNIIHLLTENEALFSKKTVQIQLNNYTSPISLSVCSLSSLVQTNRPVCSFKVALPEGAAERRLKLDFQINLNSMISKVTVFEMKEKEIVLPISQFRLYKHLSEAKINEFSSIQREQVLKDTKIHEHYENRNAFESKLYQLKEKLSSSLRNSDIKDFINPNTYEQFLAYFLQVENELEDINNYDQKLKEINNKLTQFQEQALQAKRQYTAVQKQMKKFEDYISNVVGGKIKKIKYYPKEDVEAAQKWVSCIREQQKGRNKYDACPTTINQINQKLETLRLSITKLEEKIAAQERHHNQQNYYQQPRHYDQRQYENDTFGFNPFHTSHQPRQYDNRNRGRGRNNSFNGFNSGIFPGFF